MKEDVNMKTKYYRKVSEINHYPFEFLVCRGEATEFFDKNAHSLGTGRTTNKWLNGIPKYKEIPPHEAVLIFGYLP